MAETLNGGGWKTLQKEPVGTVTTGAFIEYEKDVPSSNPAFPAQDVLTLDIDGTETKIGCPSGLKVKLRPNLRKIREGDTLLITYKGQAKAKKSGMTFHDFDVKLDRADTSFPPAANEPMANSAEAELERRLAAERARRAA